MGPPLLVSGKQCTLVYIPPCRESKRLVNCPALSTEWTLHQAVVQSVFLRFDRPHIHCRSIRIIPKQPATGILRPQSGSSGLGIRRPLNQLGKHACLCLPPDLTNSKSISQNRSGDLQGAPHCTFLASTSMASSSPSLTSPTGRSHSPTPVEDLPPGVGNLHLTCRMLSNTPSDHQAFQQTLHPGLPEAAESPLEGPTTEASTLP